MSLCSIAEGQRWEEKFDKLDEGDINRWILNQVMAPNPFVRYLTSMMYLSNVTGLSRINYPNSEFMKSIKFDKLKKDDESHTFFTTRGISTNRSSRCFPIVQ